MSRQVAKFMEVSGATNADVAAEFLRRNGGRINEAINDYFSNPRVAKDIERRAAQSRANTVQESSPQLKEVFNTYKEAQPNAIGINYIGVDGTMQYLEDLGLAPEDLVVLALAEMLESPTVGEFKEESFLKNWANVGVDSIEGMKQYLEVLKNKLETDRDYFRKIYQYTYRFILEKNEKNLPLEMAEDYWHLMIPQTLQADLEKFLEFVHSENKSSVTRDQWNMLLPFLEDYHEDPALEHYDESQSWPLLMDDFYEYVTGQAN